MSDLDEIRAAAEKIDHFIRDHNHGHASSNNPGGHLCTRECITQALAVWMQRQMPYLVRTTEEPDQGHTFRIAVSSRGSYGLSDGLEITDYRDADYWDACDTVEVRAFSLSEALTKAADLPLNVWFTSREQEAERDEASTG